ncbi:nuclease-related domain-containing protein [Pseudogracilibacillus sp. SO30301A]|uniref:nuclease-related domain-containing protein n=1 Tax=Pseudogracilibacillus sp. SO30301A TaxID=3098291 RepID=UPI00300DE64C
MILKEREISIILKKLYALDGRMYNDHIEKSHVHNDLQKKLAERRGEEAVDFYLQFLEQDFFHFLLSIRIPDEQGFFQIDTLTLSPFFILILEIKNWRGTILFGDNGQVIRVRENGTEEGFQNPIPQAYLQRYRLQKWLQQRGLNNIPIYTMVVISFPSTIIKSITQQEIPKEVIHSNQLNFRVNALADKHEQVISKDDIQLIAKQLIAEHTPEDKDILSAYNIRANELIKGVICDDCSYHPMIWHRSKMFCPKCKFTSTNSFLYAIQDFSLLISNKAKNKELRDFLQIDSPHIVKRLMQRLGFDYFGNTNGRKYILNNEVIPNKLIH